MKLIDESEIARKLRATKLWLVLHLVDLGLWVWVVGLIVYAVVAFVLIAAMLSGCSNVEAKVQTDEVEGCPAQFADLSKATASRWLPVYAIPNSRRSEVQECMR